MLCDACNVRPGYQGEHRCHTQEGVPAEMVSQGIRLMDVCDCAKSGRCKPLTKEEIQAILNSTKDVSAVGGLTDV